MNTGGGRRQQQAPQSRVAAAPLNLEPRPAAVGHDDDLTGLPDLGPTAALARRSRRIGTPHRPVSIGPVLPSKERS
jgi:hypothetical protein